MELRLGEDGDGEEGRVLALVPVEEKLTSFLLLLSPPFVNKAGADA